MGYRAPVVEAGSIIPVNQDVRRSALNRVLVSWVGSLTAGKRRNRGALPVGYR